MSKTRLAMAVPLLAVALLVGGGCAPDQGQHAGSVTLPESVPEVRPQEQAQSATPAEIAAGVLPQEGDLTPYGIPLSLDNTQRFIDYYDAIALTPEEERVRWDALFPLKAPCCDDNSMATCCCPCNLAKAVWGLSSYVITEKGYGVKQVRESALQWLRLAHSDYYVIQELLDRGIDPGDYGLAHENACYVGECELPIALGGCGGMGELIE